METRILVVATKLVIAIQFVISAWLILVTLGYAHSNVPDDIDELIHAAAVYRGASYPLMVRILDCESWHFDRRVIAGIKKGPSGEIGIAQILPRRGLGPLFESRGGDYSASDSIYFLAWALTHGLRGHWRC